MILKALVASLHVKQSVIDISGSFSVLRRIIWKKSLFFWEVYIVRDIQDIFFRSKTDIKILKRALVVCESFNLVSFHFLITDNDYVCDKKKAYFLLYPMQKK